MFCLDFVACQKTIIYAPPTRKSKLFSCRKNFVFSVVDRCNHSRVTHFRCSCRKNFVLRSWTVAITLVLHGYKPRRPWAGTNALGTTRCRQLCAVLRICPASRSFPSCPDCVSRSFPSYSVCHAPSRLLPVLLCVSRSFRSCPNCASRSFPSCPACHAPSRPALTVSRSFPSCPNCASRSFPSCPDCVTLFPVLP